MVFNINRLIAKSMLLLAGAVTLGATAAQALEFEPNTWTALEAEGTPPPARPLIVCCLDGQDAVWICLARQWGRERSE
jgi:hypothetical protein